jgi:hypothetical protein
MQEVEVGNGGQDWKKFAHALGDGAIAVYRLNP